MAAAARFAGPRDVTLLRDEGVEVELDVARAAASEAETRGARIGSGASS